MDGNTTPLSSCRIDRRVLLYNLRMSRTAAEILAEARHLPAEERLTLAFELAEDISVHPGLGEPEPGYEEWFRAGVEEVLADRARGIPHTEVVEDIAQVLRAARQGKRLKASA